MQQKTTLIGLGLWLGFASLAQTPTLPAVDVTHTDIEKFLSALPRNEISDKPIRIVDLGGYRVGVWACYRPKGPRQDANQHMYKMSEVYYMLEGSGTLVTGGTLVDPKPIKPGNPNLQGPRIEGGVSRRITKGDVVVIPGRTPHQWTSQDGDLSYLIIRPDPESMVPLDYK
jgi:mannose-6-phosphate isomerase-like protein (cupin superfamily)